MKNTTPLSKSIVNPSSFFPSEVVSRSVKKSECANKSNLSVKERIALINSSKNESKMGSNSFEENKSIKNFLSQ